jgi:hypothetical protein
MKDKTKMSVPEVRHEHENVENAGIRSLRIPESRHSSFSNKVDGGKGKKSECSESGHSGVPLEISIYRWADERLRSSGSKADRTMMAVRDAARLVARKGQDPSTFAFFVAPSIAKGWNLNIRQLSEGLKALERSGHVTVSERRKGRHLRVTIANDNKTPTREIVEGPG